ncbi:hypothetical protein [Streptomyces sp. NPDC060002]|uniref:hypothetical protein n=1 Tax=Streptomyces sp. NPDC060002 TaxID=3347033 RepID=UPI0036B671E6
MPKKKNSTASIEPLKERSRNLRTSSIGCGCRSSQATNPADRRAALLTITESGAKAVDDLFPRQLAAEVRLLEGLGEDRDWVLRALGRLVETMEGQGRRD